MGHFLLALRFSLQTYHAQPRYKWHDLEWGIQQYIYNTYIQVFLYSNLILSFQQHKWTLLIRLIYLSNQATGPLWPLLTARVLVVFPLTIKVQSYFVGKRPSYSLRKFVNWSVVFSERHSDFLHYPWAERLDISERILLQTCTQTSITFIHTCIRIFIHSQLLFLC